MYSEHASSLPRIARDGFPSYEITFLTFMACRKARTLQHVLTPQSTSALSSSILVPELLAYTEAHLPRPPPFYSLKTANRFRPSPQPTPNRQPGMTAVRSLCTGMLVSPCVCLLQISLHHDRTFGPQVGKGCVEASYLLNPVDIIQVQQRCAELGLEIPLLKHLNARGIKRVEENGEEQRSVVFNSGICLCIHHGIVTPIHLRHERA